MKSFADYKKDAPNWITMANGEFYPDILQDACELYKPVLVMFGQLLRSSESSVRLLEQITDVKQVWMRVQLYRVFRKYVSPQTPVEMLKKKSMIPMVCEKIWQEFQNHRPRSGRFRQPSFARRGSLRRAVGVQRPWPEGLRPDGEVLQYVPVFDARPCN